MKDVVVKGELRRRWNECITDVLRFYIELCKKNNLRYFIAYGSAIGAVRHHGIIPWDDDIDVVMPRPDYERLVKICETTDLGKYKLLTPDNTPNYYLPFAKMCNMETTLLESREYRCVLGMFIDIFVYEGMTDDKAESKRLIKQYIKYWNRFTVASSFYPWSKIKEKLSRGEIKDLLHYWLLSLNRKTNRKRFMAKLRDVLHAYDFDSCDTVIKYPPGYGEKEIIPKNWLEGNTEIPFENLMVSIHRDYDTVLRRYFGDYMQLPPEEEQHTRHMIAYVNLDKRETYEEVMAKIK